MRKIRFTQHKKDFAGDLQRISILKLFPLALFGMLMLTNFQSNAQVSGGIIEHINVTCHGDCDGLITVEGFGGWAPYTYEWSDGQTGPTATGLCAGEYEVKITDIDLGYTILEVTVYEPAELGIILQPSGACQGSGGSINAIVFQGTPPYTYSWSNGATTEDISGLSAGDYTLTVTDSHDCTAEATATVSNSGGLVLFTTSTYETCIGSGDAKATVVVQSGGVGPYTYLWSDGQTTDIATGLTQGTYCVTVTDANGCTGETCEEIEMSPEGVWIMVTTTDADCDENDGTAHASVMTGQPPFTYEWSNGGTGPDLTGLAPGTYTVTVTDANGCTNAESGVVKRKECDCEVDIDPDGGAICPGGSITFTANTSNTTGSVSYSWTATGGSFDNASSASPTWTMMMPGTYTISVSIIDEEDCEATDDVEVTVYPSPSVDITPKDEEVCQGESVTFNANASGGTPPYTYNWMASGGTFDDPTSATPTWTMMMPGTYSISLIVTDANGCTADDETLVTVNENPSVNITPRDEEICQGESVTFDANASGGTPPYTYNWTASGGSFDDATSATPTWTMMMPGTYTISVTVTDSKGCTAEDETTVTVNENPSVNITPRDEEICQGESVTFNANASGGTPPYTYNWTASGGSFDDATSATPTWTMMMPGTYTINVTVTDSNGCTGEDETTVTVHENPDVSIEPEDAEICVGQKLNLTANVTGGTAPYSYSWSASAGMFDDPTSATPQYMMMTPGTYTISVTVTDANGCTDEASTSVKVVDPMAGTLTIDEDLVCLDNGMATVSATPNGDANVPMGFETIYLLSQGGVIIATNTAPTFDVTAVGNYTIHTLVYKPSTLDLSTAITLGVTQISDLEAMLVSGGGNICADLDTEGADVEVFMRKVGDYVWIDGNQDGVQNGFEHGFEGACVTLLMAGPDGVYCTPDDIIVDRDTTDANGLYCFTCVRPGKYAVFFDIKDPDYVFTQQDFGLNDAIDSDADPATGKTIEIMIMPSDGDILTIDAGVHLKCDNLTVGGEIAESQVICSGQTPTKFISVQDPTGGYGNIEYLWMYSTTPGPFDPLTWIPIPNSNSSMYQSGPLTQTTYFARCARRECCTDYVESNILIVEVFNCFNGGMGELVASVTNNGHDVQLDWTVGPESDIYNYFVERSLSPAADFESIGKVSGAGISDKDKAYSFIDETPMSGRIYYRIKRVGLSGIPQYSTVDDVFIGQKDMKDIYVYPNPVQNVLTIMPLRKLSNTGTVDLIDASGKIVYSQKVSPPFELLEVDLSNLSKGLYYLRILEDGSKEVSVVKVVKMD